ncbi:MAG: hypothetical protein ABUT20_10385 [Bacteroidota bacterium]
MKKIFTLLFAVGFLMAANAQPGTRDNQQGGQRDDQQYGQRDEQQNAEWDRSSGRDTRNDGRYDNDDRYNNSNLSHGRAIELQIARINHKYDIQVQRVRNDFSMRRYEKTRVIRSLEMQRQQEIRMLYSRSSRNGHDRDFDSNRHY